MKEILYRAKAINRDPNMNYRTNYRNGDWVYGLVSRLDEYSAEMTDKSGVSGIDIDRNTICEYTGLTDKNGNKIFEGDIVVFRYGRNKDICTVVFENGAFGLGQHKQFNYNELQVSVDKETGNPDFFVGNDNYISLWEITWNYNEFAGEDLHLLEVIGNIHANPELLEK